MGKGVRGGVVRVWECHTVRPVMGTHTSIGRRRPDAKNDHRCLSMTRLPTPKHK